jgi:hypothetical protein
MGIDRRKPFAGGQRSDPSGALAREWIGCDDKTAVDPARAGR